MDIWCLTAINNTTGHKVTVGVYSSVELMEKAWANWKLYHIMGSSHTKSTSVETLDLDIFSK